MQLQKNHILNQYLEKIKILGIFLMKQQEIGGQHMKDFKEKQLFYQQKNGTLFLWVGKKIITHNGWVYM